MSDYYKTWYEKNKQRKLEYNKAWRASHADAVREYDRQYKKKKRNEAKTSPKEDQSPRQSDPQINQA